MLNYFHHYIWLCDLKHKEMCLSRFLTPSHQMLLQVWEDIYAFVLSLGAGEVKTTVQGRGAQGSSGLGVARAGPTGRGRPGPACLQCTVMGWLPDCCCCFCTAAMRSIMPLPSAGIPISGQPWKWNCRTARICSSGRARGCGAGRASQGCAVTATRPPSQPRPEGIQATVSGSPRSSHLAGLPDAGCS